MLCQLFLQFFTTFASNPYCGTQHTRAHDQTLSGLSLVLGPVSRPRISPWTASTVPLASLSQPVFLLSALSVTPSSVTRMDPIQTAFTFLSHLGIFMVFSFFFYCSIVGI